MSNIWLINNYAYPPGKSNWTRHYDLGKEIIKKGVTIDIICGSFVHDRSRQILMKNEKNRIENHSGINYHILKGISYKSIPKRILSMIEFMIRVFFYEKTIKNKPDIIYGSCPHPVNGLISLYLSKKYKAKFILEIRDLWPETWIQMGWITRKNIIYKIFLIIEKMLYKKCDKIITLMPHGYKYIEQFGINKNKVEYISNGIDIKEFDKNYDIEVEESKKLRRGQFNITYTGAHGIANCLDIIIDVAEKLKYNPEIKFHLIGDGPEKSNLQIKTKEKNLSNVEFYDPVKKNEVPNILKQSDILIVTVKKSVLYEYGISFNKIFEYMASKKATIFSGNVSNDLIRESKGGISIDSENIDEIKNAILNLYSLDNEERETMGKNARKYVEKFSTQNLGEKLFGLIEKELK
jgi:glycosyltransferase involved in cell wall biosynthesis